MKPTDSVRLLSWFFSANNPGAAPTCSMGEALVAAVQPRLEAFTDNITPGLMSLGLCLLLSQQAAQCFRLALCLL